MHRLRGVYPYDTDLDRGVVGSDPQRVAVHNAQDVLNRVVGRGGPQGEARYRRGGREGRSRQRTLSEALLNPVKPRREGRHAQRAEQHPRRKRREAKGCGNPLVHGRCLPSGITSTDGSAGRKRPQKKGAPPDHAYSAGVPHPTRRTQCKTNAPKGARPALVRSTGFPAVRPRVVLCEAVAQVCNVDLIVSVATYLLLSPPSSRFRGLP